MRNLMVAVLALVVVFAVSCSKDQKIVKSVAGDWLSVSLDGNPIPDTLQTTTHFEECKLKSSDWCPMTITAYDGSSVGDFEFQVSEKGTKLNQKIDLPPFGSILLSGTIVELTDTKLILTISFQGNSTTTEYKRK